jgi:hypothetical protein
MKLSLRLQVAGKKISSAACVLVIIAMPTVCKGAGCADTIKQQEHKQFNIGMNLLAFYPLEANADYAVTLCADLPDNNNPGCVYKKKAPGHVFLILTKHEFLTGNILAISFGFYPRVPVTCLFKKVRSKIMDNSNREYNASIEKKLTKEEFELIIETCKELSKRKYNLKKFNCYEYALGVFNSLPGIEKLPVSDVKFPFILGRGGSPSGLYRDLKKMELTGSQWAPFIRFGLFKSPVSSMPTGREAIVKVNHPG